MSQGSCLTSGTTHEVFNIEEKKREKDDNDTGRDNDSNNYVG